MRLRLALAVFLLVALGAREAAAQACPPGSWCWCESARAYYPYVASCAVPWRSVAPHSYGYGPTPSYPPVASPPPTPVVNEDAQPYHQGQADWQSLRAWFDSQTGDRRAGADYWAGNRSHLGHKSCAEAAQAYGSGDQTAFANGCADAKVRLDPIDAKRLSDPNYRAGFNDEASSAPFEPPTVQPQATVQAAPPAAPSAPSGGDNGYSQPAAPLIPDGPPPPRAQPSSNTSADAIIATLSNAFIFLVIAGLGGYFLPTIIAVSRHHHNAAAIFLLNLFLGWTFLGWVLAIVWSATAVERPIARA